MIGGRVPGEEGERIPVTVMIFTLDEEVHLPACLDSVAEFDDVIVVDSFSTDGTGEIARKRGVRFLQHRFEGFGTQRNWAFEHASPRHPWVLVLDADERVPPELAREIAGIARRDEAAVGAYRLRRRFHMWGRWLRYSALYPTWVVRLVHVDRVRYRNRGHAETEVVQGEIRSLEHDLIDENLKGIDEWFERQNRYSRKEAEYEIALERGEGNPGGAPGGPTFGGREALKALGRRLPGRPLLYFLYSYVVRGGFLEGRDGLAFCLMKAVYQQMITLKKHDDRRRNEGGPRG